MTEYCKAKLISATDTKGTRVSIAWLNGSSINSKKLMPYDHRLNGLVDQMNHMDWSLMFHDNHWSYFRREEA